MPITMNGTYYTIYELMRPLGRTHSIICRWIKRLGLTPLTINGTKLLNEEEKAEIMKYADKMDNYTTCVPIKEASKKEYLGVPYGALEKYVMSGDIPSVLDALGKHRLTDETIFILKQSGHLKGRKTDWGKVVELFKEEEV